MPTMNNRTDNRVPIPGLTRCPHAKRTPGKKPSSANRSKGSSNKSFAKTSRVVANSRVRIVTPHEEYPTDNLGNTAKDASPTTVGYKVKTCSVCGRDCLCLPRSSPRNNVSSTHEKPPATGNIGIKRGSHARNKTVEIPLKHVLDGLDGNHTIYVVEKKEEADARRTRQHKDDNENDLTSAIKSTVRKAFQKEIKEIINKQMSKLVQTNKANKAKTPAKKLPPAPTVEEVVDEQAGGISPDSETLPEKSHVLEDSVEKIAEQQNEFHPFLGDIAATVVVDDADLKPKRHSVIVQTLPRSDDADLKPKRRSVTFQTMPQSDDADLKAKRRSVTFERLPQSDDAGLKPKRRSVAFQALPQSDDETTLESGSESSLSALSTEAIASQRSKNSESKDRRRAHGRRAHAENRHAHAKARLAQAHQEHGREEHARQEQVRESHGHQHGREASGHEASGHEAHGRQEQGHKERQSRRKEQDRHEQSRRKEQDCHEQSRRKGQDRHEPGLHEQGRRAKRSQSDADKYTYNMTRGSNPYPATHYAQPQYFHQMAPPLMDMPPMRYSYPAYALQAHPSMPVYNGYMNYDPREYNYGYNHMYPNHYGNYSVRYPGPAPPPMYPPAADQGNGHREHTNEHHHHARQSRSQDLPMPSQGHQRTRSHTQNWGGVDVHVGHWRLPSQ